MHVVSVVKKKKKDDQQNKHIDKVNLEQSWLKRISYWEDENEEFV